MASIPDHIAAKVGNSLAEVIVKSVVHGNAAVAPHVAQAKTDQMAKTAAELHAAIQPKLVSMVGDMAKSLPDNHPLAIMLGAATSHAPTDPDKSKPPGHLPPPGTGFIDDIVNAFMVIFGIIGMALGVLPAAGQVLLRPFLQDLNVNNTSVVLPPADLADMVERNIVDETSAAFEAAKSGISKERFDDLVLASGEPPGLEQMLRLWNRGLLDSGTLDKMIAYSRVRTEWTQYVKLLAHDTMSTADALEAVLKGEIPEETGQRLFVEAGGLADQFQTLLNTAGNPIGVEAALNLYNHNQISLADVQRVIRHSRVNPMFEGMALLLRHKWLSVYQISQALKGGNATPEQATTWMLQDGYPPDQVAAFVNAATKPKVAKAKDAAATAIEELYQARFITQDDALTGLANVGYTGQEAQYLLELADAKRVTASLNAAVSKTRSAYIVGHIDDTTAKNNLAQLGVPPSAVDEMLTAWSIEKATNVKVLSEAHIGKALKDGLKPVEWAVEKFMHLGYTVDDARLLADMYGAQIPIPATGG